MISVKILSGQIIDELAIAGDGEFTSYMKTEGKQPGAVFDAMIYFEMEWEVDYKEATDEEYQEWSVYEIVGRITRAHKKSKPALLDGVPVNEDEVVATLIDFISRKGFVPDVIEDNAFALVLGDQDEE